MPHPSLKCWHRELAEFREFGKETVTGSVEAGGRAVPVYLNEFWTAKQRDAHRLHEISYRACFKPQLPRFFIERLTQAGDVVFDPFMGRGTTLLEAALLGRVPMGNDINPLSSHLVLGRLNPPLLPEIENRLAGLTWEFQGPIPEDLLVFYHEQTLRELCALRSYLLTADDPIDRWIRMVALNRLTGHSPGFFSVYTLPPNQAVSIASQRRINAQRNQTPPYRDVRKLILSKSRKLLAPLTAAERQVLASVKDHARLTHTPARSLDGIADDSVHLVVTSPPFLDVVDYATDNWLRCWFAGIDVESVHLTLPKGLDAWQEEMTACLRELRRVLKPGGFVAFEVGEVRKGKIRLEESVLHAGLAAGLSPQLVLINAQVFTKTANCWGVANNALGTNTNRVVVFRKD